MTTIAESWKPMLAIGLTLDWTLAIFSPACQASSTRLSSIEASESVAFVARMVRIPPMSR